MISATQYRMQAEVNRQTQLSTEIAKLQTDISTGVRIQTASDDPAAAAQVATIRQKQAQQATYQSNVTAASATASSVDATMANVGTALVRFQELLIQANSATSSATDRASVVSELNGLAKDITGYANETDSNGQPLFPVSALAVPVDPNSTVAATPSRADVFTITDAGGNSVDLATYITSAAATVSAGGSLSSALTTATNAINQVSDARAAQGVRASRIEDVGTRLTASGLDLKTERSDLESTDVTQTVADLQAKMTTLQAAQALLVKVSNSNLFSLLS